MSRTLVLLAACFSLGCAPIASKTPRRPNVILVITDDQGYGDIGAHGNSMIRTPHLDRLHGEAVRLTDYHVDPTCSPTRSALISGRYSTRTGVWHTINGRSLMRPKELTLAEIFRANGYRTAMFGKWHLGDNWPLRPQDQGFEHVVWHHGGGVTQGPDYFDNDYFDDTYEVNGHWKSFDGYCTDVWFDEAIEFISGKKEEPFFAYISTNAPHGPFLVADSYSDPYEEKGVPTTMAKFYGMITNIDENVGRLREALQELGLAKNTLLIFTTDNGTAAGVTGDRAGKTDAWAGFNDGMRGRKGSEYDGGHRVPCFWHWPAGALASGRDVDLLTAHIDVLPTLVELCDLKKAAGPAIDGASIAAALRGQTPEALKDRTLFVHSQRIHDPQKWRKAAVMTPRWRLVNARELYDMKADPGQQQNVAADHPDVVNELTEAYDRWWKSLEEARKRTVHIGLGGAENPVRLMSHDWLVETGHAPWHQNHVRRGQIDNGPWAVRVAEAGPHEIRLYRWAPEAPAPIRKGYLDVTEARLRIGDIEARQPVTEGDEVASFRVELPAGETRLQTWFSNDEGRSGGAFYVMVKRLD